MDISGDEWGFYVKGEDGWKLMGYLEAEPAPLTLSDLNGSYCLSHIVSDSKTHYIGDEFYGITLSGDLMQLELDEGVGHFAAKSTPPAATNITCTIAYDKLIMAFENAIDIAGQLYSVYELDIVQDGEEIYLILEEGGDYYYLKKSDQGGNQGDQNGGNTDANTSVNEIILLVDASDSLNGIKSEVNLFIESVINSNNGSKIGIVTFGYDQVYAAELSANTTDTYAKYLSAPMPDITATNIADAITYASTLFTRPERSKIVLISDGAETDGDATHVIKSVAAKGIIVDTVCFAEEAPENEVQILSIRVPDKIAVGQSFEVKATIQSSYSGIATIKPFDNGVAGEEMEVELFKGIQTVSIPFTLPLPGLHELSLQLACNEDGLAINNCYTTCVYIQICDKLLIIENIEGESDALRTMLSEDLNVSVVNVSDTSNMPTTVNELREYDQVILVNVANRDMPEGFDRLLYSYVRDFGGGLFTVCGNKDDGNPYDDMFEANAYTREDMYGTVYQQLLPVDIIDYTPPVAVVIIIDNSGSISVTGGVGGKSNLDFAKEGAIACLDALTDRDYVGIVTLSDIHNVALEITPRANSAKIISAIEQIEGGGGTNFYNAFERAGRMLTATTGVEKRHIILVTDGLPTDNNDNYKYQVQRNAENGITMSIVGIRCNDEGRSKMIDLLRNYGGMSERNFYDVTDLDLLPLIMRENLMIPEIKSVNYETFRPTYGSDADHAIIGNLNGEDLPTLDGYYGAKAKEGAEVIIKGPYNVPIYTQWKFGLGTVGTFACDLNGIWSQDFINSYIGKQLINNIVNNLFPTHNIRPSNFEVSILGDNYSQKTAIITDLEEGQYVELSVRNLNDYNKVQTFTADAASGTRFSFSITSAGIHEITVRKKDASGLVLAESVYYKAFSYSKEYDKFYDRESAAENLANIAKSGNGNVIQSPADVFIFNTPDPDDKEDNPFDDPYYYNVSILDVRTKWNENNRPVIEVDIVCYRRDMAVDLYFTVDGESMNGSSVNFEIVATALLLNDEVTTISIGGSVDDFNLASYNSITVRVNEKDGDESDNVFTREMRDIRILYSSTAPDVFVENFLLAFRSGIGNYADVEFTVFNSSADVEIPTVGYDVYIYEHRMPDTLPTDGVSIIFNPDSAPKNSGFTVGNSTVLQNGMSLKKGGNHPIMSGVAPKDITITKFLNVTAADALTPILYCNDHPVAFASEKSDGSPNVVVFSFSLSYSDFALLVDFPLMMCNIIEYYTTPDPDGEGNTSTLTLADTYSDTSGGGTSNSYTSGMVFDGVTYYKELLEMYSDLAKEALKEREDLTKIQKTIIEIYFAIL